MAFYINPPRGSMRLANLERISWYRFQLLMDVATSDGNIASISALAKDFAECSDGLIEGSQKDLVSHFLVRLACAQNPDMESFFISAETRLFAYRCSCMTQVELLNCVKPLKRLVHKALQHEISNGCQDIIDIVAVVNQICADYDWSSLTELYAAGEDGKYISISFSYVLDLVRKRSVRLADGKALVPCSKLSDVLQAVFGMVLAYGLKIARKHVISIMESDRRIEKMLQSQKAKFYRQHRVCSNRLENTSTFGILSHGDVEDTVQMFPLCMQNLHWKLKRTHHLKHLERIQYTLFLKEIGLPLHEAVKFWRREYSLAPSGKHSHSFVGHSNNLWEAEQKRYLYSIRHLYGFEGSRKNYSSHCCRSLQEFVATAECGGCPFKNDNNQLILNQLTSNKLSSDLLLDISNGLKSENPYNDACLKFMFFKLDRSRKLSLPIRPTDSDDSHTKHLHKCPLDFDGSNSKAYQQINHCVGHVNDCQTEQCAPRNTLKEFTHFPDNSSNSVQICSISETEHSKSKREHLSFSSSSGATVLMKPSDFFFTYRRLINDLQQISC